VVKWLEQDKTWPHSAADPQGKMYLHPQQIPAIHDGGVAQSIPDLPPKRLDEKDVWPVLPQMTQLAIAKAFKN